MTSTRLRTAYVMAPHMPESRAFYEAVLGLTPRFADGDRWTEYEADGARFALGAPSEHPDGSAGTVVVFEVADLDAVIGRLAAGGTETGAVRDMGPHGRVATVLDPAGNRVQLFERAPRPAAPASAGG